jgi:glyoxylase-like metal-dependent hydrolase (beta-lactamase superfamily II)
MSNVKSLRLPITIDCHYLQPQVAAAYLLVENDEAVFVETNTTHAVPYLLDALRKQNLSPDQVKYLIITHVHLDHAGGASALMQACPNAVLLAHPRAAIHMVDPTKLVRSARAVYGDENFTQLYGEINPVDAKRVRSMQDGETISFGSRELNFFYTRGHANHHFCILDSISEGVFSGDAFGLAYPALQKRGLFIFPSTTPTDFDPAEARLSIQKILTSGARRVFLTHFGEVDELEDAAGQLMEHLDFSEGLLHQLVKSTLADDELVNFCENKLREYFAGVLEEKGLAGDSEVWELLKLDLDLNAAGIAFAAKKLMAKKAI